MLMLVCKPEYVFFAFSIKTFDAWLRRNGPARDELICSQITEGLLQLSAVKYMSQLSLQCSLRKQKKLEERNEKINAAEPEKCQASRATRP